MVLLQRDPAGRNMSSQRYLLFVAACLILGRTALAQVYPNQGASYTPNAVFNDPAGYGPGPVYYPPSEPDLLPIRGDQEPGALNNVSFSQGVGDLGSVNLYGSPDPETFGAGAGFSANPASWVYLRDLQAAVYTNQEQTVVNGGTTFTLFSNDRVGLGGRALFGATVDDDLQDELHFSGDVFAGVRLPGEIWLKGGFLYDTQDVFYKYGPTVGAVFMADAKHPITMDFAYGRGEGDIRPTQDGRGVVGIADDDVQLRVGTYISPTLQLGVSGNWARWDDTRFQDDQGLGGFARMSIADLDITFDVTEGDRGTRGFVNVAYVFGGPHRKTWRDADAYAFVDRPQDWLTRPVIRDTSLKVQSFVPRRRGGGGGGGGGDGDGPLPPGVTPAVGNLTQITCQVQIDPAQDATNPGVLDPGDGFSLILTLSNGTNVPAFNISITNVAADQAFVTFNSPQDEVRMVPNVFPGGQETVTIPTQPLGIDPSAVQGSALNVSFEVMSDGQVRRFQCGPIVLGQTGNATPAAPVTPIN